jgi:glucose/arabinose dehydrogenase
MPPVTLPDEQLATVFGYVFAAWGNRIPAPGAKEMADLRATTKFPTFEALIAAMGSTDLPPAPEGWDLRVGAELSFSPIRLVAHPDGIHLLILAENGDVWKCRVDGTGVTRLIEGASYLDPALGRPSVLGMTVDRRERLYLVSNQRNETVSPVRNEVTIFRTNAWANGNTWSTPKAWLRTAYPWGVGPYNHGVSNIAEGPDGFLYVNSGARTDGGEAGSLPNYATTGEDRLTSCMWRLDPNTTRPTIEIFARGLRNNFGFCWDEDGHLLATENGPDADAPEELNLVEQGKHYGFPFQFSDWSTKPYPYTPNPPRGLVFTKPFCNIGPDAKGPGDSLATFEPHSCPAGIVWLGPDWPAPFASSFLVARFGNLLKRGTDAGFDVLQLKPDFVAHSTSVARVLGPLARPIDLLKLPGHQIAIAEYCRGTTLSAGIGTPGRLLLLTPKRADGP